MRGRVAGLVVAVSAAVAVGGCSDPRGDDGGGSRPPAAATYDGVAWGVCEDLLRAAGLPVLSGSDWRVFLDAAEDDRAECGYQTTREPTEARPDVAVTVRVDVEEDDRAARQSFEGLVSTAAAGTGFGGVPEMTEVPGWWAEGWRFERVLRADSLVHDHPGRAVPELQVVVRDDNLMASVRVTSGPARRPAHGVVAQARAICQAVVDGLPDRTSGG